MRKLWIAFALYVVGALAWGGAPESTLPAASGCIAPPPLRVRGRPFYNWRQQRLYRLERAGRLGPQGCGIDTPPPPPSDDDTRIQAVPVTK